MRIIVNRTGVRNRLVKKLRTFLREYIKEIDYKNLEIVFVSDATMRKYNRNFAVKNSTTDVLSFDLGDAFVIVVSVDTARKNAIFYGERFEDELVRYVIHGILHLIGYDHKIDSEGEKMRMKEQELLRTWKVYYYS